jgi:hypothetical protein
MMPPRTPDSHLTHVHGSEGAIAQTEVVLQHGAVSGRVDLPIAVAEDRQVPILDCMVALRGVIICDVVCIGAKRICGLGDVSAANAPLTYRDRCE